MALKQLGNFMPSAQQVAGTLPGGAAGPPTFGADEEMWKKAAAAAQKQYEQPAA